VTLDQCKKLGESRALTEGEQEAREFYDGEMWRDGAGWIGQKPPAQSPEYRAQLAAIRDALVSENVIAEVVHRHRAGVLGREPRWGFVPRRAIPDGQKPSAEEAALMVEADAALTAWWDRRKPLETLQGALPTALLTRRAPLRLFVPAGLRGDDGTVVAQPGRDQTPLDAALALVYLDAPAPDTAGVFADDTTRREASVFTYRRFADGVPGLPASGQGTDCAEIAFVVDDGATIIRVIEGETALDSAPLPLGGRLPVYELRREPLVTPQVRQGQKAINLALTQMVRNVNLAGSLERIMTTSCRPASTSTRRPGSPGSRGTPRRIACSARNRCRSARGPRRGCAASRCGIKTAT